MSRFPDRYREVSVTEVDVPLEAEALRSLLTSRPAYRRTRYVVARSAGGVALVELRTNASERLFVDVDDVRLLAGPDETVYLSLPALDTAVPSALVAAAQEAPWARCVVVEGRYGHVSFVLDPSPLRVHVLDVAPPWPAKLVDQVERLLETGDDLPAVVTTPHVVDLHDLISRGAPSDEYLLQCRGGGMEVTGSAVSYLDQVPARRDWTLVGCARSRAIHDFFYGGDVPQIDTCPRALVRSCEVPADDVLLTKCCLLEEHVESEGRVVVVPWGASFGHLRDALEAAVGLAPPVPQEEVQP
jgi:hypothetical protein